MRFRKYDKDTIGYHYNMARALFGNDSKSVKWLLKKAKESPNGLKEKVMLPESQVIQLLGSIEYGKGDIKI